jgi:hypothetical protein
MALNKLLSGILDDFTTKRSIQSLERTKQYEYLVNFLVISKFHPEAFVDSSDLFEIDVDKGSMFGIDAVAFVVNDTLVLSKNDIEQFSRSKNLDVKIIFIQTKTEEAFDIGSILKLTKATDNFFSDSSLLEENEKIRNAKEIYNEIMDFKNSRYLNKKSPEVQMYYVTAGRETNDDKISTICRTEKNRFLTSHSDIKDANIFVLGREYISESFNEFENRIEVNINFKNNLSLDKIDQVEQSYLGYISGHDLIGIITDSQGNLRRKLFYENVRDFQGEGNPVNSEIAKTVCEKELQDKFILLNNGITIVAKHLKYLGSNVYEMRDFQIVNGCQTSNEIFLNRKHSENILVPMKIIHTTDSDLISMIVKATNRQTPVPDEAFIALEKYHKLLQDTFNAYSKNMPIPLFYERRSGEFDFLDTPYMDYQKVTLHGLIRAITSVYFHDAYVIYNNNPTNILRSRSSRLFKDNHIPEIYYISNYLLANVVRQQEKGILSTNDYADRFYLAMIAKNLLSGGFIEYSFDSADIRKEAQGIISKFSNEEYISETFKKSKEVYKKCLESYKKEKGNKNKDLIRRDPVFNDYVIEKLKKSNSKV